MAIGKYGGLTASFAFVALMELGGKTQLSIIALSVESGEALMVFIGAIAAFAIITSIEVHLGGEIKRRVKKIHELGQRHGFFRHRCDLPHPGATLAISPHRAQSFKRSSINSLSCFSQSSA